MKTLIYFKDNGLVKAIAGENSFYMDKEEFNKNIHLFKNNIIVCYGLSNYYQAIEAIKNNIPFIYVDNCYFGNLSSFYTKNKKPIKNFYRITVNELNLTNIKLVNKDRFISQIKFLEDNYNIGINDLLSPYRKYGKDIIIVPPSGKIIKFADIDVDKWINDIINKVDLKKYNPIIRYRSKSRNERFVSSPIQNLFENAYCTVTFSSMAAVDSLLYGVPSFIYNPTNNQNFKSAALPLSVNGIDNFDNRFFPKNRKKWLYHLAYGQYSRDEIESGYALKILMQDDRLK